MVGKLTQRSVTGTQPGTVDVFLWDTEQTGFGLKVTPKGKRMFIVQYWSPKLHGVKRRITLGQFGTLTVEQARRAAVSIFGEVARGGDPAAEQTKRRREVKEATVAILGAEYLDEVAAKKKSSTEYAYRLFFTRFINPNLGKHAVVHLSTRDVAQLHLSLKETPYQANRVLQLLKAFLYWCERHGYRDSHSNPCPNVQPYKEVAKERYLTLEEVSRLNAALYTAETVGLPPAPEHRKSPQSPKTAKHRPISADVPIPANMYAVAAIRFLVLSGWREQEALTLRWDMIDFHNSRVNLPDTKTGRSYRVLGDDAEKFLLGMNRIEDSPYVFPGRKPDAPLREIKRVWCAVRHAAELSDVRLHDLRHTVAAISTEEGNSLYVTGKLLGHARAETTQRYAHLRASAEKAAADKVSKVLADAMARGLPSERNA